MIVADEPPTGKAGGGTMRRPIGDQRILAFCEYVEAIDNCDCKALARAGRLLRAYQISVCILAPRADRGTE